jgi:folate-binding protein YgfZ
MTRKLAELRQYGALEVHGADARAFLHGQLTNDVQNLAEDRARYAGWCSPKGRLLASVLIVPWKDGYLLQLARDIAPAVAKRLSMFILRAKVKVEDASDRWVQFGAWGDIPGEHLGVTRCESEICVLVDEHRYLMFTPASERTRLAALGSSVDENEWTLEEIRAGRPLITQATQDQFVPQMVNFERLGAVDFQKGCYPGQEIVARAQYRGQVKRRMVQMQGAAKPGEDFNGGTVVDAARGELLVVTPV